MVRGAATHPPRRAAGLGGGSTPRREREARVWGLEGPWKGGMGAVTFRNVATQKGHQVSPAAGGRGRTRHAEGDVWRERGRPEEDAAGRGHVGCCRSRLVTHPEAGVAGRCGTSAVAAPVPPSPPSRAVPPPTSRARRASAWRVHFRAEGPAPRCWLAPGSAGRPPERAWRASGVAWPGSSRRGLDARGPARHSCAHGRWRLNRLHFLCPPTQSADVSSIV